MVALNIPGKRGRYVFEDYRLRIARVIRDYGMSARRLPLTAAP
jgi:hypothetical protein